MTIEETTEATHNDDTRGMWGMELVLDLHGCNPETIASRADLVRFAAQLCDVIDMRAFGDPIIARGTLTEVIGQVVGNFLTSDTAVTEEARNGLVEALTEAVTMGNPLAVRFALDDPDACGYTLVQLIETSSIVAHFSEKLGTAYINIFSCKEFDPDLAATFTTQFFAAAQTKKTVLIRR